MKNSLLFIRDLPPPSTTWGPLALVLEQTVNNGVLFPAILQTCVLSSFSRLKRFSSFSHSSHGKCTVPVTILSSFLWSLLLLLYLSGDGEPTIIAIGKTLVYAIAILCSRPHWYAIWHRRKLRLGSHQCNPFFSVVRLLWAKSGITYHSYLSESGKHTDRYGQVFVWEKKANKYEMEKWIFANWYVIKQNEWERTLHAIKTRW